MWSGRLIRTCSKSRAVSREDLGMWKPGQLVGKLLVAAPVLTDPHFDRTVVLIIDHSADGALGLVLNRPTDTPVIDALEPWAAVTSAPFVLFGGGPVQPEAAFCLALVTDPEVSGASWSPIVGRLGMADLDRDPFDYDEGVAAARLFVGYAGWSDGQLEQELREQAWFVCDAVPSDALSEHPDDLWRQVLRRQAVPLSWVSQFPDDPNDN
jgi:putative transcriptional regulator